MKKLISTILTLALLGGAFSGCASATKTDTTPSADPVASSESPSTDASKPVDESTTVTPEDTTMLEEAAMPDANVTANPDNAGKTLAFSIHFKQDDYGVMCAQGFEDTVKAAGFQSVIVDANGDPQKQLSDIESLIAQKVDVIGVSPMDESAIKAVVNQATTEAKIPVVSITAIPGAEVTCTIDTQNYNFAKDVAKEIAEKSGNSGQVAIINAPVKLLRLDQRLAGFEDAFADAGMEVVSITEELSPEDAQASAAALLTQYPDLKAIVGTFSNLQLGAAQAVKSAGNTTCIVGGVDADSSILNLMKNGPIYAVAAQFAYQQGQQVAQESILIAEGKTVPKTVISKYKVYLKGEEEIASQEVWNKQLN